MRGPLNIKKMNALYCIVSNFFFKFSLRGAENEKWKSGLSGLRPQSQKLITSSSLSWVVQSILEPSLASMMRVIVLCVTIATINCQK